MGDWPAEAGVSVARSPTSAIVAPPLESERCHSMLRASSSKLSVSYGVGQ
jgi:hypothetical protein